MLRNKEPELAGNIDSSFGCFQLGFYRAGFVFGSCPLCFLHVLNYQYSGINQLVRIASAAGAEGVDVTLEKFSASGVYDEFDRFGRPTRNRWKQGANDLDSFSRSYDFAASNVTNRDNLLKPSLNRKYEYDNLFRLVSSDQGNNADNTNDDRLWKLDQLGNQQEIREGLVSTSPLLESRTFNDANELQTSSLLKGGFAGAAPEHDDSGNMTRILYANDAAISLSLLAKYDAWNRLADQSIGTFDNRYQYDGLHRRIARTDGSNTTHYYYNENWQVLTETNDNDEATAIYNVSAD